MSGFSADWLALRAGADARARDRDLAARLGRHFADVGEVRVLDLGAGSGANLRATAPLIEASQHWLLADNDAGLLARAVPIPKISDDEYNTEELLKELKELKEDHPDKNDVIVASEDAIQFQAVVQTMDTAISARFTDVSLIDAGGAGI